MIDFGGSHQANSAVAVFVVVPVEELPAVSASILDQAAAQDRTAKAKACDRFMCERPQHTAQQFRRLMRAK